MKWEGEKENAYYDLGIDTRLFLEVVDLIHDIEYSVILLKMWWKWVDVDYKSLRYLSNDQDAMDLARYALSHKCKVDIYVMFGLNDYKEVTWDKD